MTPAIEDFDTIRQRMRVIIGQKTRECFLRTGRQSSDCWCFKAGPDGNSLPCPPKTEEDVAVEVAATETHDYDCG